MQYKLELYLPTSEGIEKLTTIENLGTSEWGTFKDSLRAPIHGWFPYPAGFSNKAVEHAIHKFGIAEGNLVYDPFAGTGTTNIVAKTLGINSVGIEAHPFVYFVARTKTYWDYETNEVLGGLARIERTARESRTNKQQIENEFPELVQKCFSYPVLRDLYLIREAIRVNSLPDHLNDFFNLALTCILRQVSNVATGWPYIAPNKKKSGIEKNVFATLSEMVLRMYGDIQKVRHEHSSDVMCQIINGDARDTKGHIEAGQVDFIFTSPPYLNNYDYADRTRLETYFMGWAKDWGDISNKVRTQLIMSATTQINRGKYQAKAMLSDDMWAAAPEVAGDLQAKINTLSEIRLTKGGKKSYDILVGGYFNDMFQVLRDCFRLLKAGSYFALILGDSAPYGVHLPTEIVLGDLGRAVGFTDYHIEVLRKRGDKWKDNPQRHKTELRESILYLKK